MSEAANRPAPADGVFQRAMNQAYPASTLSPADVCRAGTYKVATPDAINAQPAASSTATRAGDPAEYPPGSAPVRSPSVLTPSQTPPSPNTEPARITPRPGAAMGE